MKNKILKVLICGLLVSSFLLGTLGCGGNDGSLSNGETSTQGYTFVLEDQIEFHGTHEYNVKETSIDLVKDGKSEYVLVFPDKALALITEVKTDFINLFKKATGVILPIKSASDVVNDWTPDKKYISVGDHALVQKAEIDSNEYSAEEIKAEGVRIITKGNTQFILGGSIYGVNNAVYTFFEIYFNFDFYHRSCIDLDTGITDIKFKDIDVTDIPDVGHYSGDENRYGYTLSAHSWDSKALGTESYVEEAKAMDNRMRVHTTTTKAWVPIHEDFTSTSSASYGHTVAKLIPNNTPKTYTIPRTGEQITIVEEMFPAGGSDQLCLTAHGNPDIYEDMVKFATEKIIFGIMQRPYESFPGIYAASVTCMDNWDYCDCDYCIADIAKYGSSGQYIRFVNEIGKRVNEWLDTQEGQPWYRDRITVYMFGYHNEVMPPVDTINNADGSITYVPKDESVIFNEYADVFLVSSGYFGIAGGPIYDSHDTGASTYLFPGWKAVSNGRSESVFWYNSPLVGLRDFPYDAFGSYNPDFWEMLAYYGYQDVMFDHYTYSTSELTGWETMLVYLCAKLRWNCNLDTTTLIKKYMKAMYKDAADIMYGIFNDQMIYYTNLRANAKNPVKPQIEGAADYPYPVLERWINMFKSALTEVDYLKETDPDLYYVLETRIMIEMAIDVIIAVKYYGGLETKPFNLSTLAEYKAILSELSVREPGMKVLGMNVGNYVGA